MNQKGFANILLIALIVVLVGVVGYLTLAKKKTTPTDKTNTLVTQETQSSAVNNSKQKTKLSLDILKNGEYSYGGQRIKLVNGTYPLKPLTGESQADYFIKLDTEHVVFGDLNNDGQEDAAVVLVSRSGGTGTFRYLVAVLNQNGTPLDVARQYLGDRVVINSLLIQAGVISINMTPWDGGTGTSKTVQYKLSGNKLLEI